MLEVILVNWVTDTLFEAWHRPMRFGFVHMRRPDHDACSSMSTGSGLIERMRFDNAQNVRFNALLLPFCVCSLIYVRGASHLQSRQAFPSGKCLAERLILATKAAERRCQSCAPMPFDPYAPGAWVDEQMTLPMKSALHVLLRVNYPAGLSASCLSRVIPTHLQHVVPRITTRLCLDGLRNARECVHACLRSTSSKQSALPVTWFMNVQLHNFSCRTGKRANHQAWPMSCECCLLLPPPPLSFEGS